MPKLTEKQEAFCQAYIENGGNKSEAYRTAYNAENMGEPSINVEAHRIFKSPNIALRVLELQEEHRERHNVTVDSLSKELDEARELAKEVEQPAAMTGATMGKAKLHGLVTDKKEHKGAIGFIDLSGKSDEELKAIINGS
jgi:phage terminase small subunit